MRIKQALSDILSGEQKYTQTQIANELNIDQSTLSKWLSENIDLNDISGKYVKAIASITGKNSDDLLYNAPLESEINKSKIKNCIKKMNEIEKLYQSCMSEIAKIDGDDNIDKYIKDQISITKNMLNKLQSRVKINLVGPSDVGKSSFYNYILEQEILKVKLQPTTAVNVIIKHNNDKPDEIEKELSKNYDDSIIVHKNASLTPLNFEKNIYNKNIEPNIKPRYVNFKSISDIVNRNNGKINDESKNIAFIIHYINSDILQIVDLIDTPGLSDTKEDAKNAVKLLNYGNIIIYMDQIVGFINNEASITLFSMLKNSLDFEQLFIIMSRIDADSTNPQEVINEAYDRLQVNQSIFINEEKEYFKKITYGFSTAKQDKFTQYRTALFNALVDKVITVYEKKYNAIVQTYNNFVNEAKSYTSTMISNEIEELKKKENNLITKNTIELEIEDLRNEKHKIFNEYKQILENYNLNMDYIKRQFLEKFNKDVENTLSGSNILSIIDKNNWNESETKKYIANELNNQIVKHINSYLGDFAKKLSITTMIKELNSITMLASDIYANNAEQNNKKYIPITKFFSFENSFKLFMSDISAKQNLPSGYALWLSAQIPDTNKDLINQQLASSLNLSGIIGLGSVLARLSGLIGPIGWIIAIGGFFAWLFRQSNWKTKLVQDLTSSMSSQNTVKEIVNNIENIINEALELPKQFILFCRNDYETLIQQKQNDYNTFKNTEDYIQNCKNKIKNFENLESILQNTKMM